MLYTAIHSEGALIPEDILDQIIHEELPGQKAADFGFTKGTRLGDEIARAWSDAQDYWRIFGRHAQDLPDGETGASLTRERWMAPLLNHLLGYELTYQAAGAVVSGQTFPISHRAGPGADWPPVQIAGFREELDRRPPTGYRRLSPQALVQEYLNRTEEYLWGAVSNGCLLRLLRQTTRTSRPSYLEFDLQSILSGQRYNEFALFFRLCHRTRLPRCGEDPHKCLLEDYFQRSIEQGGRVREKLRVGVESALRTLGTGFLAHVQNTSLREKIQADRLTAAEFHRQLLRLIYRLLFLMVAEERKMIAPEGSEADRQRRIYQEYYSVARLRELAEHVLEENPYCDLWLGLKQTFHLFSDVPGSNPLGIPPLNGELFSSGATRDLNDTHLRNQDLVRAMRHLSLFEHEKVRRRINYAALDVEELGSVYESLLDLEPVVQTTLKGLTFDLCAGTTRKSTGSYYTRPELVAELIKSALVPALEERVNGATTREEKEWAILGMKVCDPASGSGHFLLAAARRMGRELAKVRTGEEEPTPQEFHLAVRDVIAHCLYAVDKNPLAVDLCKVALWLEGHWTGKPLSFLDHRVKCGDSLVGVLDLAVLKRGIPDEAFNPVTGDDKKVASAFKKRNKKERESKQRRLAFAETVLERLDDLAAEIGEVGAIAENTPADVKRKADLYQKFHAGALSDRLLRTANLWTAAFFSPLTQPDDPAVPTEELLQEYLERPEGARPHLVQADVLAAKHTFFHWFLELPEVFAHGGFDVVLGNPPFMGGLKMTAAFGDKYRNYIFAAYEPFSGRADLSAAFFRLAFGVLRREGRLGMVGTNSIGQGETRTSGLAAMLSAGGSIEYAHKFIKWPGDATVEVNLVAVRKTAADVIKVLDGAKVTFISSRLDTEPEREPYVLSLNRGIAFQGSIVLGSGFLLTPEEASELCRTDPANKLCLFPYLTGEDLNSQPEQLPSRWVIQFDERDASEAQQFPELWRIVTSRVYPERILKDRSKYPRMVEEWWKHWNNRHQLYLKARELDRVLVRSRISEIHSVVFVPSSYLYSEQVIVFAVRDDYFFALLQSAIHEIWARRNSSTLRTDVRYTPTKCFETFPLPSHEAHAQSRANDTGSRCYTLRSQLMTERGLGLTKIYNLFHDPQCSDILIEQLRRLHADMDHAVAEWYGWKDLDLSRRFLANERGQRRYAIDQDVSEAIFRRLSSLNYEYGSTEGVCISTRDSDDLTG